MGNLWLPDLDGWLRFAGLEVSTVPGWLTRSRSSGGYDDIRAIGMHHDAMPQHVTEARRVEAEAITHQYAPVGALHLHRDGSWTVMAAGATNTQGRGGPVTTSRGVIPLDSGNRYFVSIEASNDGVGQTWPPDQLDAYIRGVAAIIDGLANLGAYDAAARRYRPIVLEPADVLAHFEWTSRKIDPADGPAPNHSRYGRKTDPRYGRWNMDHVRGDIANTLRPPIETRRPMTTVHTLDPERRLVDTRPGQPGAKLGGGPAGLLDDTTFTIPLPAGLPPGIESAVVTVTAVNPTRPGWLTLWGDKPGDTSKLNPHPNVPAAPNTTTVAVGRDSAGRPVIRGMFRGVERCHLIVDLVEVRTP